MPLPDAPKPIRLAPSDAERYMRLRRRMLTAAPWAFSATPEDDRGLVPELLVAAVACARTWEGVDYVDLAVSENASDALRLYERQGFEAWGREPQATAYEGRRFDEIHMTLRL